jgi:UDP-glucose 4-epimerase
MTTNESIGKPVNVGSDDPITILQLAELVQTTLDSKSNIEFKTMHDVYGDGFEDLQDRQPDLTRLNALVGTRSRIPLTKTIASIAESLASVSRTEQ